VANREEVVSQTKAERRQRLKSKPSFIKLGNSRKKGKYCEKGEGRTRGGVGGN